MFLWSRCSPCVASLSARPNVETNAFKKMEASLPLDLGKSVTELCEESLLSTELKTAIPEVVLSLVCIKNVSHIRVEVTFRSENWTVYRRPEEFALLHSSFLAHRDCRTLPSLIARKAGQLPLGTLQHYLTDVCRDVHLRQTTPLYDFLRLYKYKDMMNVEAIVDLKAQVKRMIKTRVNETLYNAKLSSLPERGDNRHAGQLQEVNRQRRNSTMTFTRNDSFMTDYRDRYLNLRGMGASEHSSRALGGGGRRRFSNAESLSLYATLDSARTPETIFPGPLVVGTLHGHIPPGPYATEHATKLATHQTLQHRRSVFARKRSSRSSSGALPPSAMHPLPVELPSPTDPTQHLSDSIDSAPADPQRGQPRTHPAEATREQPSPSSKECSPTSSIHKSQVMPGPYVGEDCRTALCSL